MENILETEIKLKNITCNACNILFGGFPKGFPLAHIVIGSANIVVCY